MAEGSRRPWADAQPVEDVEFAVAESTSGSAGDAAGQRSADAAPGEVGQALISNRTETHTPRLSLSARRAVLIGYTRTEHKGEAYWP